MVKPLNRSARLRLLVILLLAVPLILLASAWDVSTAFAGLEVDEDSMAVLAGEIRVWAFEGDADAIQKLAPAFHASYPGLALRVKRLDWADGPRVVRQAALDGTLPDVLQIGTTWLPEFTAADYLLPLDRYFYRSSLMTRSNFFSASRRSTLTLGDTPLYSVPFCAETRLLVGNRRVLARLGCDTMPATWDDLRALRRRFGRPVVFLPENDPLMFATFVWQEKGDIYDWHARRFQLTDSRVLAGLAAYKALFRDGVAVDYDHVIKPRTGEDIFDAFRRGAMPFFTAGPWILRELRTGRLADFRDQTALALMPALRADHASFMGGSNWGICRGSSHVAGAWRFIEFMTRPETQLAFHRMTGQLPAVKSGWEASMEMPDAGLLLFLRQQTEANTVPGLAQWEAISDEIIRALKKAGVDPERNRRLMEDLESEIQTMVADRPRLSRAPGGATAWPA